MDPREPRASPIRERRYGTHRVGGRGKAHSHGINRRAVGSCEEPSERWTRLALVRHRGRGGERTAGRRFARSSSSLSGDCGRHLQVGILTRATRPTSVVHEERGSRAHHVSNPYRNRNALRASRGRDARGDGWKEGPLRRSEDELRRKRDGADRIRRHALVCDCRPNPVEVVVVEWVGHGLYYGPFDVHRIVVGGAPSTPAAIPAPAASAR